MGSEALQANGVMNGGLRWRIFTFALMGAALLALSFRPLSELMVWAWGDQLHSYIPLIPPVSGYLIIREREHIFREVETGTVPGLVFLALGGAVFGLTAAAGEAVPEVDRLSGMAVALVLGLTGCFGAVFGTRALRRASFSFCFLLLMAPIPSLVLEWILGALQRGSAEVTHVLFMATGVPFLRDGFTFQLPGMTIEVAPQCGGIRSSISLMIVSLLVCRFFLHTTSRRVMLVLSVIPITLFKNGVRIVTLSLLGVYVDPRILGSELHRSGGIPFFAVALALLLAMAWGLRKTEKLQRIQELHHEEL